MGEIARFGFFRFPPPRLISLDINPTIGEIYLFSDLLADIPPPRTKAGKIYCVQISCSEISPELVICNFTYLDEGTVSNYTALTLLIIKDVIGC